MLKTIDIINEVGEEYSEMLKQINIPDFYKCIAQFSGLKIEDVADSAILNYLKMWCQTKKKFFNLMNKKVRMDIPFDYIDDNKDFHSNLLEIAKDYPGYYFWLNEFGARICGNKLEEGYYGWELNDARQACFPFLQSFSGLTLTHFFKKYLQAPDDLVTRLGRVFENNQISATFTISIDPVDMMLASETPYGWTSCYRLENDFCSSHADGCLAAIIDDSSLITYVWNNEGKFSLYNNFTFKNIRYKRMRMWIAVDKTLTNIHFNSIYPNKKGHSSELEKSIRNVVETFFAKQLNKPNIWGKNDSTRIYRGFDYGYAEFEDDYIWVLKNEEPNTIDVYNNPIICPCGCGEMLPGSDGYAEFNGEGHIYENYYETNEDYEYEDEDK